MSTVVLMAAGRHEVRHVSSDDLGTVVHEWDVTVTETAETETDCWHCCSVTRQLGPFLWTVEHSPRCPWLRAEPPFDEFLQAGAQ
jgi:hypothetical protein